jgi:hypothetical protein
MNRNGVVYRSFLVNIAVTSNNDGRLVTNATTSGGANGAYQMIGYDAFGENRDQRRFNGYNYFYQNDATSSAPPLFDLQRWLVVVDGTTKKVLYNKVLPNLFDGESLTMSEVEVIRDAVNQAELPDPVEDFSAWAEARIPDAGARGEQNDPDGDGMVNLLEYAYGTNPVVADSGKGPRVVVEAGNPFFVFQRSTTALVSPLTVLTGDSPAASNPLDLANLAENGPEIEGVVEVRVPLTTAGEGRLFLRLSTSSL